MKAVVFTHSLPIDEPRSLFDIELPDPVPGPRDLLVAIDAVAINPADAKRRMHVAADGPVDPFILGYDAVGVVRGVGAEVSLFGVGDTVWYAGDATRQGSYATLQTVDERIVGHAPRSVAPAQAASLPLTSLTAWELLFDRMGIAEGGAGGGGSLLVIGAAGGVGSITIQLAAKLTNLNIVATASRPETAQWCRSLGAHDIVNHKDLVNEAKAAGHDAFSYIVQYADTSLHWDAMCELVAPQGKIGTIVETPDKVDISKLQGKSAALVWELMFTRSMFQCDDMAEQGRILDRVAKLVDAGDVVPTTRHVIDGLNAENLKRAHTMIETASTIGKIVVTV